MIGMKSSREPIRGIMAKKMHEHLVQVEGTKQQGKTVRLREFRKTNVHLVEITNDAALDNVKEEAEE